MTHKAQSNLVLWMEGAVAQLGSRKSKWRKRRKNHCCLIYKIYTDTNTHNPFPGAVMAFMSEKSKQGKLWLLNTPQLSKEGFKPSIF